MLLIKEGYVYNLILHLIDIFHGVTAHQWPTACSLSRLHDHTQSHHTVGFLWMSSQSDAETST